MNRLLLWSVTLVFLSSSTLLSQPRKYKRWLEQEVGWIISKAEIERFQQQEDNADRDAFIEEFWNERDPSPGTLKNEFKERHFERLKFATENFNEGMPGWRTDRGRVWIIHGPPVSRSYQDDSEIWTYNSNPNAEYYRGPISLLFRRSGSAFQERLISESRYAQQKAENRPGAGPNPIDQLQTSSRYRLVQAGPGNLLQQVGSAGETDRYIGDMLRSPGEVLEKAKAERQRRQELFSKVKEEVKANVSFEPLPFQMETFLFRGSPHDTVVFRLGFSRSDLQPETQGEAPHGVDLYCEIANTESDYVVDSMDESLALPAGELADGPALDYTNQFAVPAGNYRVLCLTRGIRSGRTSSQNRLIGRSPTAARTLELSKPVLTQQVKQVERGEPARPLVLQDARFQPSTRSFDPTNPLFLYFQIYNTLMQGGGPRPLYFDYQIYNPREVLFRSPPRLLSGEQATPTLPYAISLDLSRFHPGEYHLLVKVIDPDAKEYALATLPFELRAAVP